MSEPIPVSFLCAVSRDFGWARKRGIFLDIPKNERFNINFILKKDQKLPEKPGTYRWDGCAVKLNSPCDIDYNGLRNQYEFTGKFNPIMIPGDDWHETKPENQRCVEFI